MSTFQNQNQFAQTPVLGEVDLTKSYNVKSVKINPASVATVLQAGQVFKIVDIAGPEIIVDQCTALTDTPFGVAIYSPKKNVFVAGQTIEVACDGTVVYLESSAAAARGASVQLDSTGPTVATLVSPTNGKVGFLLDKPTAAGQLVRVEIKVGAPGAV